jgi:energy-coupling factor transporter ATP-binding protein EcfA2
MSKENDYPSDYRAREIALILDAVQSGECACVVGLSGSGKSNLLRFLYHHQAGIPLHPGRRAAPTFTLVDCNRLRQPSAAAFFQLLHDQLECQAPAASTGELNALEECLSQRLQSSGSLCLLLDRFDVFLNEAFTAHERMAILSNLRVLRDTYKYRLTYVIATRQPLDSNNELAELFFANNLWLGPLSESDVRWNIQRFTQRKAVNWDEAATQEILHISWGYPSLLRAICEAHASGAELTLSGLSRHPAVLQRVKEFWLDDPSDEALRASGLWQHPLLFSQRAAPSFDPAQLTAKEHLLCEYFQAHPDIVCTKDDLIRAVWPEDRIFERGVRDDSLAQLVRRLREKIEPDPSAPRWIHAVPGRGYRYTPD